MRLTCPQGHAFDHAGTSPLSAACPVCGCPILHADRDAVTLNLAASRLGADEPHAGARMVLPLTDHHGLDSSEPFLPFSARADGPSWLLNLPGYEILGTLGRGGMGVVYKARQRSLKRLVALKMILAGTHASAEVLSHFRAEAEAVASLQHPNIVQIYEVGRHDGSPFFSMEYIDGCNLADHLAGKPQPPRDAAALVETLARAIHHAHERGIVHRDLKPANVLLPGTPYSVLRTPKITDFGLARRFDSDQRLTRTGVVLGTPNYMAPEQIQDRIKEVGPATDVYALGAILYECLTGRPPFLAPTAMETATQVLIIDPVPPRKLQPDVPADLETICLKCLHKETGRRYASAEALAEDLRRFLDGRPITARPVGGIERGWKWARRRPAVAALSAAVVLITVLGFALVASLWVRAEQNAVAEKMAHEVALAAQTLAEEREETAERERRKAERLSALAALDIGVGLCEKGNADHGLVWMSRGLDLAIRNEDAEVERIARVALHGGAHSLVRHHAAVRHKDWSWDAAFSPDCKRLATASKDGTAHLVDPETGREICEPLLHQHPVWAIAFSPDGKYLLTGSGSDKGQPGEVRLWDAGTGKPVADPIPVPFRVASVAFSSDGTRFLVATGDRVLVWPIVRGKGDANVPVTTIRHPGILRAAVFSPDGTRVLTGGGVARLDAQMNLVAVDGEARLWDAQTGRLLTSPLSHQDNVESVAFSPDGRLVATTSWDHTARVWDAATGRPVGEPLQHHGPVKTVRFSPDSRLVATGCVVVPPGPRNPEQQLRGEARLWDALTGRPVGSPLGHPKPVWSLAFSPNGRLVLTGCEDGKARFFLTATGSPLSGPLAHQGTVRAVAFSPDGRLAITTCASGNGAARIWSVPAGLARPAPCLHPSAVSAVAFSPDGKVIATACGDKKLRLWDAVTHKLIREQQPHAGLLCAVAFRPDGKVIATAGDRDARLWDVTTGQQVGQPVTLEDGCTAVIFTPDGNRLFVGGSHNTALVDLQTGQRRDMHWWQHEAVAVSTVTPDGKAILVGSTLGDMSRWNVDAPKGEEATKRHRSEVVSLAVSPDGRLAVSGSWDNTARIWEVATGRETTSPLLHAGQVRSVAFGPDGRCVATATEGGIRLWDTATGQQLGPQLPYAGVVTAVAFSPDGKRLVSGGDDGRAVVWDLPREMTGDVERLRTWCRAVTGLAMEEDRTIRQLSAAEQEEARRLLQALGGPPEEPLFADKPEKPAEPEKAPEPPAIPPEAIVLPRVGAFGRNPLPVDALEAQIVAGKWTAPKAGEAFAGLDGKKLTWEALKADKNGVFQHQALLGGYAYLPVTSDRDRVMILEAAGHVHAYVNCEPRAGDVYSHGYVHVPVVLKKGVNDLLFLVGRGSLRAKLIEPKAEAMFNTADLTLPDLIAGTKAQTWGSVVVLNATDKTVTDLVLRSAVGDNAAVSVPIPSLPPFSVRKAAFRIEGTVPADKDKATLELQIMRKDKSIDSAKLDLGVRKPEQTHKQTFISRIDGSVQYYGLVPAKPTEDRAKPGLVLTLHGAAVEGIGQAAAYGAKPGLHIVAPTNRRPYGFDWEDWGRLDAMEVLDLAQKELGTDPRRTYLTGHSMGGHGTWHVGVTYPDRFAAIGPSAGWISMWSYAGASRPENPNPLQEIFLRCASPSDTLALSRNYLHEGVYILHGEKDDNVPVEQGRTMKKHLEGSHKDLVYHEQPGAGHWWGNQCVDWPKMFEFLEKHKLPERKDVREVEFVTASPGVSADCDWLTVEAQTQPMKFSKVKVQLDPEKRSFTGKTENVARLSLDVSQLKPGEAITVELDGQKVAVPWPDKGGRIWLGREKEKWAVAKPTAALKNPQRYGPFREAFRNRMVFVYGTKGAAEENAWALAKARFDAETFWYRGNGSVDVIADTAFDPKAEPDRNVILYGHAESNAAWKVLLGESPLQVKRGVVKVGDREEKGDDLACLFVRPRPGSDRALVGAVSGTGMTGLRLTNRVPSFYSGVGYPDWVVFGPEVLTQGVAGARGAGFFGIDWGVPTGEAVWRK